MDNNRIHKLFASTETDTQYFETTQDKHMTHLPFSFISKDDLIYLSFNSNNKEYVELEIIKNIENNLKLNEINIDKCDYFTDIDNNTTLDGNFKYYDVSDFNKMIQPINQKIDFSIMHTNIQSLKCNGEKLECLLTSMNGKFDIIALSETWHCEKNKHLFNPIKLDGYCEYEGQMGSSLKGGCGLYVKRGITNIPRVDLDKKIKNGNSESEMKWIEIIEKNKCNKIIGVIYRHPNIKDFIPRLTETLHKIKKGKKETILSGDFNYDLLTCTKNNKVNEFITNLYENMLHPCITQPTRIIPHQRPTIIDNIFINSNEEPISGNIINRISDHFPNFIVIKTEKPKGITETTHYKRYMKNYNPIIFTTDLEYRFEKTNYQNQNTNELSVNIINTFTNSLEYLAPMEKLTRKQKTNKNNGLLIGS